MADLPRVSSEWGDEWVTGVATDAQRLATYRATVRAAEERARATAGPLEELRRAAERAEARGSASGYCAAAACSQLSDDWQTRTVQKATKHRIKQSS